MLPKKQSEAETCEKVFDDGFSDIEKLLKERIEREREGEERKLLDN